MQLSQQHESFNNFNREDTRLDYFFFSISEVDKNKK